MKIKFNIEFTLDIDNPLPLDEIKEIFETYTLPEITESIPLSDVSVKVEEVSE